MPNFLILATAWGPKFGGINAFNMDFARGLAELLGKHGTVFCGVLEASAEEIDQAKHQSNVVLLTLGKTPNTSRYDVSWALELNEVLNKDYPGEKIDYWVGHDVVSSAAAIRGAELSQGAKSAVIMHMNYEAYQSYKTRVGQVATEKLKEQTDAFSNADFFFANGPLLEAALADMVPQQVTQLVPGFAEIEPNPSKAELTFITFGRMDRENDRIKQGSLSAAGFGQAINYAHLHPATPRKLKDRPRLNLIGIDEPGGTEERLLRDLANKHAGRVVSVIAQQYDDDRGSLHKQISRANVAMMLSWHEGFGLTAWEAIAGQVPLIVSKNTGVWRLLSTVLDEDRAATYVQLVDVQGLEGHDDSDNFAPEDATSVRDAILKIANDLGKARTNAAELKQILIDKLGCTWKKTARDFCTGLGLHLKEIDTQEFDQEPAATAGIQSKSTEIAIPQSSWPMSQPIPMPDSFMLRPEAGIVRFHSFRETLRDQIIDWVVDPDQPIKLRLHSGVGGVGKTRLMIEVCKKLKADHNWQVGFLQSNKDIEFEIPELLSDPRPTALVLDYAETRASDIIRIVQIVLKQNKAASFRILLLSRSGGDWWNYLGDGCRDDPVASSILHGHLTKFGPYNFREQMIEGDARKVAFREAREDFAKVKGILPADIETPNLSADHFGAPIFIHMAALASLRDTPKFGSNELIDAVLGHEKAYWKYLAENTALEAEASTHSFLIAVAMLTLVGGCASDKEARALFDRTPRIRDLTPGTRDILVDQLKKLYGTGFELNGLQPDILGERLVAQALELDNELLDTGLGKDATKSQAESTLTVLARMARRDPDQTIWLKAALSKFVLDRPEEAITVARETGDPMAGVLVEVLTAFANSERRKAVRLFKESLPEETKNLLSMRVLVEEQHIDQLNFKTNKKGRKSSIKLMDSYDLLAEDYSRSNRFLEAANAQRIAYKYARNAYSENKPNDMHNLAASGLLLAFRLRRIGKHQTALKLAAEGFSVFKSLEQNNDLQTLEALATASFQLSNILQSVGNFEEALDVQRQSTHYFKTLDGKYQNKFRAEFADSLADLADNLLSVGNIDEAYEKVLLAQEVFVSVPNQGSRKNSEIGRSIKITLSNVVQSLGKPDEALIIDIQLEDASRILAEAQPEEGLDPWIQSLSNLAVALNRCERHEEALEKLTVAIEKEKKSALEQPLTYEIKLGTSLANRADTLIYLGKAHDALDDAEQAISLISEEFDKYPDANRNWLAFALRAKAEAQILLKELPAAKVTIAESVRLWADIQASRPGYETLNVLKASHTLMKHSGLVGNLKDLTDAFQKCIKDQNVHITRSGAPGQLVIQNMIKTLRDYGGEDAMNEVPEFIGEFAESTKFTYI